MKDIDKESYEEAPLKRSIKQLSFTEIGEGAFQWDGKLKETKIKAFAIIVPSFP